MEINSSSDQVMVSVICLAYNHEKFIVQTLDGFIKQKTSFKFEVIVHDDASTDNTARLIMGYENKYPDIIKPIYQQENQYSKHVSIVKDFIFPKTKGKYLAWCEGDDYWTDENKLQMQVDALENNDDCNACFSKVAFIDVDNNKIGMEVPYYNETQIIQKDEYIDYCLYPKSGTLPFQISGFMMKRELYSRYSAAPPEWREYFDVGDIPLFLYVGTKGNVYYINKVMSCYRTQNASSWSAIMNHSNDRFIRHYEVENKAFEAFDHATEYKYHSSVNEAIKRRQFMIYSKMHNVRMLKSSEFKDLYNKLSWQRKITHYLYYCFPHFSELLKRIRNSLMK